MKKMLISVYLFVGWVAYCGTTKGTTSGVGGASSTAAQRAVGQIASFIYTLAIAILIVSVFVGLSVGAWNTIKHIRQQNIDLAEIIILWCQVIFIITIMFASVKIAKYISTAGVCVNETILLDKGIEK